MERATSKRARAIRPSQAAIAAVGAVVLLAAVLLAFGGGPAASRTWTTASPGDILGGGAAEPEAHYHPGRPAHIHTGTCDNLGRVAFPLNPVGAGTMAGAAMADMPTIDAAVEVGSITLDVPLQKIAAGRYALNVQISEFEYGRYVACGDIGGVMADGTLNFGLREVNGSGFGGLAQLTDEGSATRVTVYLVRNDVVQ